MTNSAEQFVQDLWKINSAPVLIENVSSSFGDASILYRRYQELNQDVHMVTKFAYSAKLQQLIYCLSHTNEWKSDIFKDDREVNEKRFIIIRKEMNGIKSKLVSMFNQSQQSSSTSLTFDPTIAHKIITKNTSWPYIPNGSNFCAFQSTLASITTTESYVTFFEKYNPISKKAKFCCKIFALFHDALCTALANKSPKTKYDDIINIINKQIVIKKERPGQYFSITEALNILDFNCDEIVSALQRSDVGAGNCVTLNFCSNPNCLLLMDGVGQNSTKKICKWKDFEVAKHLVPLIENCKSLVIESNSSCVFSEINILLGGHPMGKCFECNHCRFSLNFRQITSTVIETFGHQLGLYSNFDVNKLYDIPAIGSDGRIYKYKAVKIYFNEPLGVHWRMGEIDWDSKSIIDCNSSGGKVTRYDWNWFQQQQPYIQGMILQLKDVPPDDTIDPTKLISTTIKTCKLTANDIKYFQPRMITKLITDRGIWELFEDEITVKSYRSRIEKNINDIVVKPGDIIKLPENEIRTVFKSNEYRQTFYTKDDKLRDILFVWERNYESKWSVSYQFLNNEEKNMFKKAMMEYWKNTSTNKQLENIKLFETGSLLNNKKVLITSDGIEIGQKYDIYNKGNFKIITVKVNDVKNVQNENWYKIKYKIKNKNKCCWVSKNRFMLD
eukprot:62378_1